MRTDDRPCESVEQEPPVGARKTLPAPADEVMLGAWLTQDCVRHRLIRNRCLEGPPDSLSAPDQAQGVANSLTGRQVRADAIATGCVADASIWTLVSKILAALWLQRHRAGRCDGPLPTTDSLASGSDDFSLLAGLVLAYGIEMSEVPPLPDKSLGVGSSNWPQGMAKTLLQAVEISLSRLRDAIAYARSGLYRRIDGLALGRQQTKTRAVAASKQSPCVHAEQRLAANANALPDA